MKRILVLGAGQSAPFLIKYLLEESEGRFTVTVADRDPDMARERVQGHIHGRTLGLDAEDQTALFNEVREADVIVNMLAPRFQAPVARLCLRVGRSMVSASYRSAELLALEPEAKAKGLVFASELGLDPGLDHMSSLRLIRQARADGGEIHSFYSYGGGLVDADSITNPLGYAITWNPRNVVMAGEGGARFKGGGSMRFVPYPRVFESTWNVDVPGAGRFEAYLNRDSLGYGPLLGIEDAQTLARATLRYPGYCETWSVVARLGMANEEVTITDLAELRWRDLVDVFLAPGSGYIETRVAQTLSLHPGSRALENLRWLGLFSDERIGDLSEEAAAATTPATALIALLRQRLALPEGGQDMVILHHVINATARDGTLHRYTSTLLEKGEANGVTAMARTVGLPAALATLDILDGNFPETGCPIPTSPTIALRLLEAVERSGLEFIEDRQSIESSTS